MARKDILQRKDEIEKWVAENRPKTFMYKQLSCRPSTLETYLKKFGIAYKGNVGAKGYKKSPHKLSAVEYMKADYVKSPRLRTKLIEDGIKPDKCERCGLREWMGQKLPLELHHKDGNRFNNELSNLEINCPNCHSLTPNHSKKKQGN